MRQGNFRFALKRETTTISTDLAGVLNLDTRYTDVTITSGQSLEISTIDKADHLGNGHYITIRNTGTADVIISASLMANNVAVDIEQDTVVILNVYNDKFIAAGGSSEIKDVSERIDAHTHEGTDTPRINSLDLIANNTSGDILESQGDGTFAFTTPVTGRFRSENTDIITNINSEITWGTRTIPLMGTVTESHSDFTVVGDGLQCNFNGRVKVIANAYIYSSVTDSKVEGRFKVGGVFKGAISACSLIRNKAGHNSSSIHLIEEFDVTSGQIIELIGRAGAAVGTATLDSVGTSSFIAERIR